MRMGARVREKMEMEEMKRKEANKRTTLNGEHSRAENEEI